MLKLREPFSQKVHLHIRQNMLQRLWDKYVPASSPAYEQIQLVYLKDALGEMEKQPQRIQLLLRLILTNKMMQLNLMQYPALVKVGQKQMERRLRQIERYYAAQLKSCDFTMFRTVRQYFTLLDQAEESSLRYQNWLKDYQEIEKQREEYRLLSLFSVKLRELLTERSVNTLRTMEREFVDSLSKTEYRALAEELIWQEKPELVAYLKTCGQTQCGEIFKTLEKDIRTKEAVSLAAGQSVKEKLIAVVEQLEQEEFCLFYHQVTETEEVSPQMVIWEESKTQMLHAIDGMNPEALQQVWKQIEEAARPLKQNTLRVQEKDVLIQNMLQVQEKVTQFVNQDTVRIQEKVMRLLEQNMLQTQGNGVPGQDTLQTIEKELVDSLSETEYMIFAEELIWHEKPELITYLKERSIAQCEAIVGALEKDAPMNEMLKLDSGHPVKEELIAAVEQLERKEFCLFYHQVMKVEDVNPQMVIWEESRTRMLDAIERQNPERLQQMWNQIENTLGLQENEVPGQDTLQTIEKELVDSLSEAEYKIFTEELIWHEKSELITYLKERSIAQCEAIVSALENDVPMNEMLKLDSGHPVKEELIAAVEQLEQKEFCLFYHQVMKVENVNPQMVIWEESRTRMLDAIERQNPERLLQIWNQIEKTKNMFVFKALRLQENEVPGQDTLQTIEKELVDSLSETEYKTFAEELIWHEKPELITYLKECTIVQCEAIVSTLEKDASMNEMLKLDSGQPVKEELAAAVEQLGQKEFCLFYHQIMKVENVNPQMVIWEESRTRMLDAIDRMNPERLQQMWNQIEKTKSMFVSSTLRIQGNDVSEEDALRIQEKELVHSLLKTEYRVFAEELIWKEKPEFVAYLKECSKARCKEIVKELEKDIQIKEVLSSVQKQSVRKKLAAAARKLKQPEFSRFYWQIVELKGINPPLVIWKKNKTQMLYSLDEMKTERLQEAWVQMEAAAPVRGMKTILSEKMLHLQNQYQQKEIQSFHEQITTILKENDLEKIADIVNAEQLMQDFDTVEYIENGLTENTKETELLFKESSQLTVHDEVYQVIQKLEQERKIRRERIERQQDEAVATYQKAYYQILETEDYLQQENVERLAEQTFLERHQEKFTREEIRDIREWSRAFLEVCFVEQGRFDNQKDNENVSQGDNTELIHMIEQINHYIEMQHGSGERLILNWQENLLKDERIQKALVSVRELEEEQRQKLTQYLADMMVIWQEVSISEQALSDREADTALPLNVTESEQRSLIQRPVMQESRIQDSEYEFTERALRMGDRELARNLLQIENREFAEKLLRIEDKEIVRRLLRVENRELVEKLLQNNDILMPDVSYRTLWEWGETLLFHPEHQQEGEDADIISVSQQDVVSSDGVQQEDIQTQVIRHQIAMAKDRNHLQRLIRQINHQADTQLVYADAQLKLPEVQDLLHYIRQLDEKQYGVLVKELAQITKIQKMPYDEPKAAEEGHAEVDAKVENNPVKTRVLSYPMLMQRVRDYEKQHRLELYREIGKKEQRIFPKAYEKGTRQYTIGKADGDDSPKKYAQITEFYQETEYERTLYEKVRAEYELTPYEGTGTEYGRTSHEETGMEYGQTPSEASGKVYETGLFEEFGIDYARTAAHEKTRGENKYQPQELEYSAQKFFASEEDQQRKELRIQQENAQIKSAQEQLDKKLKEVEHQLKKVEDSAKAKEDVGVFAEQVKRQLYEELHVEKLRRGLV